MADVSPEDRKIQLEEIAARLNEVVMWANADGYNVNIGLRFGTANERSYTKVEVGDVSVPFWAREGGK